MDWTTRRKVHVTLLAVAAATLVPTGCGSSSRPAARSTEASRPSSVAQPLAESLDDLVGTWSVQTVLVDGVRGDNGPDRIELTVAAGEASNVGLMLRIIGSDAQCDMLGGEWFVASNKVYLAKLNLQAAVACELPEPSSVKLIRTAIGLGALRFTSKDERLTLSSELVTLELRRV